MADASDSKSDVGDYVWVQVPSPAWVYRQIAVTAVWRFFMLFASTLQSIRSFAIMGTNGQERGAWRGFLPAGAEL